MVIYMNKYALINNQNIVDNIVIWDGSDSWQPPQTMTCINVEGIECSIGWAYDGSVFTAPVVVEVTPEPTPEPIPPTKEELLVQLNALSAQIQSLT
jgi:hypothetical protein